MNVVVAAAAVQHVSAVVSEKAVVSIVPVQRVVSNTTVGHVSVSSGIKRIVSGVTEELIETVIAGQRVVARISIQQVVAGTAQQTVFAGAAVKDRVLAGKLACIEKVVAIAAGQNCLLNETEFVIPHSKQTAFRDSEVDVTSFFNGVDPRSAIDDVVAETSTNKVAAAALTKHHSLFQLLERG